MGGMGIKQHLTKHRILLLPIALFIIVAIVVGLFLVETKIKEESITLTVDTLGCIEFRVTQTYTEGVAQAFTADYIADGVDDWVQWQAAVDSLPAGGGKIQDICGTIYDFTNGNVTITNDNIVIQGLGNATYFRTNSTALAWSDGGYNNILFKDFGTTGNVTRDNSNDSYAQNIWVRNDYFFEPAGAMTDWFGNVTAPYGDGYIIANGNDSINFTSSDGTIIIRAWDGNSTIDFSGNVTGGGGGNVTDWFGNVTTPFGYIVASGNDSINMVSDGSINIRAWDGNSSVEYSTDGSIIPSGLAGDVDSVLAVFEDILYNGVMNPITITDNGGRGISWTTGEIYVDGTIINTDAAGNTTLDDNDTSYLYGTVAGSSTLILSTVAPAGEFTLVAEIYVYDGDIEFILTLPVVHENVPVIRISLDDLHAEVVLSGGLITSINTDGTNPNDFFVSAGVYYLHGTDRIEVPATISSSGAAFGDNDLARYYHAGGVWAKEMSNGVDFGFWDDGNNKAAVNVNNWYVGWIYIEGTDHAEYVYPQVEHATERAALAEQQTYPPLHQGYVVASASFIFKGSETDFTAPNKAYFNDIRPLHGGTTIGGVQNLWYTITSDAGATSANDPLDNLNILGAGTISTAIVGDTLTITGIGGGGDAFETMVGTAGTNPVAIGNDTLNFTATGPTLTITGNAGTDTLDFVVIDDGHLHTQATLTTDFYGNITADIGWMIADGNDTLFLTSDDSSIIIEAWYGNDTVSFEVSSDFLKNVVEDLSPQLGANLDGQTFTITAAGITSQTADGTDRVALVVTQDDLDTRAVVITNNGDDNALQIDQDAVLSAANYAVYVYSNEAQVNAGLMWLRMDNAGSDEALLRLTNDGDGPGIYFDSNGNGIGLEYNHDSPNHGISISIGAELDPTKHGLYIWSNTEQDLSPLVRFYQADSGSSAGVLHIDQNAVGDVIFLDVHGNATAFVIDSEAGNATGVDWDFQNDANNLFQISVSGVEKFAIEWTGAVTFANAYTLPIVDGALNEVLTTDGGGIVTWQAVSGDGNMTDWFGNVTASGGDGYIIANGNDSINFTSDDGSIAIKAWDGNSTIDLSAGGGGVATDSIWNAKGDLAVGTGANAAIILGIGTDNFYLKVGTDTPAWEALDISDDSSPQLGGSLDAQTNNITNLGSLTGRTNAIFYLKSKLQSVGSAFSIMTPGTEGGGWPDTVRFEIYGGAAEVLGRFSNIILAGIKLGENIDADGYSITNYPQSIADNSILTVDHVTPVSGDYAKFTAIGLEGRSYAEALSDLFSVPLPEDTLVILDTLLSADEHWSGTAELGTMGYGVTTVGDLMYLGGDGKWELAQADSDTKSKGKLGICLEAVAEDATCLVLLWGKVRSAAFPAFTVGGIVYISEDTAGDMETVAPTGSGEIVRIIGYANTAEELYFCPSNTYVELA